VRKETKKSKKKKKRHAGGKKDKTKKKKRGRVWNIVMCEAKKKQIRAKEG